MKKQISENTKSQKTRFYFINIIVIAILAFYSVVMLGSLIFLSAGGASEKIPSLIFNSSITAVIVLVIAGATSSYLAKDYIKKRSYRIIFDILVQIVLGLLLGAFGVFLLWLFLRYFPM